MFEKYDTNKIYKATIEDHGLVLSMDNMGGCLGIETASEPNYYETYIYMGDEKIIDIYNPNRVMNHEIILPVERMPIVSKNKHLYTVVKDSLVKFQDITVEENPKGLKRTLFSNKKR